MVRLISVCGALKRLCGAATACGELAYVIEEDGALEGVELGGVCGDLGKEGVGHEDGGLVAVAGVGVAQEGRDVHLEGLGQPVERGEGGHGLAVLDLGDVGARHVHARGELTLGEVAHVTEVADSCGDLEATFCDRLCWDEGEWSRCGFRFLNFEGLAAAPAESRR